MCLFIRFKDMNPLAHRAQWYGFFPVWLFMCLNWLFLVWIISSMTFHGSRKWSPYHTLEQCDICILCICLFRCFLVMNSFPHIVQFDGFGNEVNSPLVRLNQHPASLDPWCPMLDGKGGWASRAESNKVGGARGAWPVGHSSIPACWLAREAGPSGKRFQLASLVITWLTDLV